jgi:hypothetical protein
VHSRTVVCLAALVAFASVVSTPCAQPAAPPIGIDACLLFTDLNAQLGLLYTNESRETLKSITFRARYGSGWLDFVDKGTFAPGAPIQHLLRIPNDDGSLKPQPSLNLGQPQDCRVVHTESISGSSWTDPAFGADYNLPTPHPDNDVPATNAPLVVVGCTVMARGRYARVKVRYQTQGRPTVETVFRARYASGAFDIDDESGAAANTFVARTLTTYDFPGAPDIYGSIDEADNCVPIHVTFADGSTWVNPRAAEKPGPLPTWVPAALDLLYRIPVKRHEHPDFFSTPSPTSSPS